MTTFESPLKKDDAEMLSAGDIVFLTGRIFTARDQAHKRIVERGARGLPKGFVGGVIFHCGPIIQTTGRRARVVSAGPTTSARMAGDMPKFVKVARPSAVIGKGGLPEPAALALVDSRCPYLSMPGGTAALAASRVRSVRGPFWKELGSAESVWEFEVEHFGPLIVAIDVSGRSLYDEVTSRARRQASVLFKKMGVSR